MLESPFDELVAWAAKTPGEESVYPAPTEELALVAGAAPKRRSEVLLGRAAAHQALGQLLGDGPPVGRGDRGMPLWPEGVVGSITHTDGIALAAVARREHCSGLGIDVERRSRRVSPGVARLICLPSEVAWVQQDPELENLRLKSLFSAKESLFKALFPLERVYLGYVDAELCWDPAVGGFRAVLRRGAAPELPVGAELLVGCRWTEELILTYLRLPLLGRVTREP